MIRVSRDDDVHIFSSVNTGGHCHPHFDPHYALELTMNHLVLQAWVTGCLGIVDSCSASCETAFKVIRRIMHLHDMTLLCYQLARTTHVCILDTDTPKHAFKLFMHDVCHWHSGLYGRQDRSKRVRSVRGKLRLFCNS